VKPKLCKSKTMVKPLWLQKISVASETMLYHVTNFNFKINQPMGIFV